ncbi:hypothetical protein UPYG_G00062010 [Umbra pygmaea]|uniref:DUF8040 domain-containing protein n=1 Tax=Umbra pygmaea TaxID=75934 RepID=A0ABD0XUG1_UMBPY
MMDLRLFRRRPRIFQLLANRHCRPSVLAFNRSTEWWDVIVSGFTNTQWVQNFRMSEETVIYLCDKLRPMMERHTTNFRGSVPIKKRVAIALWKLATGSEYRSVGHLFGVSGTTVCRCVQDFCAAAKTLLVPEQICLPDPQNFEEMAVYTENRWRLRSVLVLLMVHTYPSWHHNCTTVTTSTVKAGTPSSFKLL